MSTTAALAPTADAVPAAGTMPWESRLAPTVLAGFALSLALCWPRAVEIWRNNLFADTDDAMRLVQVRSWLAGQGWFDLVAHRLAPPAGILMHWSRVVDVPVAALIRLFGLGLDPDHAERLARIVFPLTMQLALLTVGAGLARLLIGPRGGPVGILALVLSGFMFEQFPPGRIDHHAPQIVVLVGVAWALLASLRGRPALAGLAALGIAASLAISLENLPFLAVMIAVLPIAWVHEPSRTRRPLGWLAGGLASGLPLLFAATIPAARWGQPAGDCFAVGHLVLGLAGSVGLAVLAALGERIPGEARRWIAVILAAAPVLALAPVFPETLRDPYAGLDPVLSSIWLGHVTEAQPLLVAGDLRPATLTMLFCPLALGTAAAAAAWHAARCGFDRLAWCTVLTLAALGTAGIFWEIRIASTAQPFAALGGAWIASRVLSWATPRRPILAGVLAFAAALPCSTLGWALVPVGEGNAAAAAALEAGRSCRTANALRPLAGLPEGLVFAPIDDGSHLLVATPHRVLAAPYHRNGAANRAVIDGFLASPETAEALVRRTGARYLAVCPGEVGIGALAEAAPHGLGSSLTAGAVPSWLVPVPLTGTPYRVFTLVGRPHDETVM